MCVEGWCYLFMGLEQRFTKQEYKLEYFARHFTK